MSIIWPKRRSAVAATALLALLALFAATFLYQSESSVPIAKTALVAKACGQNLDCLANALADIMEVDGIDAGLAQMSTFSEIADLRCHAVSHATGKEMYQRVGKELLTVYEELCDGGFTHGWMADIENDSKVENLVDILGIYCEGSPSATNCSHGIGHSLGENNVSVTEMADICVKTAGDAVSAHPVKSITGICVEGWMMGKREVISWESDKGLEDALLLCKPLKDNLHLYCAGMAYRYWIDSGLTLKIQRIAALSQYCETLKDIDYIICTEFLGQAIGDISSLPGDIEKTIISTNIYCSLDNENSRCLNGVLYVFSDGGIHNAKLSELCMALRTEFFEICNNFTKIP